MSKIMEELTTLLTEKGIPFGRAGRDPQYIYYPARSDYVLRVEQYEEDSYATICGPGAMWIKDIHYASEAYDMIAEKHFVVKKAVDVVQEEIGRLTAFDAGCEALSRYARNLNLLALQGKIFRAYGRESETEQILRIMLRKTKPNALLVGSAGCGKTAIVESLAYYITDARIAYLRNLAEIEQAKRLGDEPADEAIAPLFNDTIIYDLDLSAMVGGTKYRGEFEERLSELLKVTEKNPNIVLFIDEIHQLNGTGAAEGSSSMGQMMKPALARGAVHCIGATTDAEAAIVYEDKALARRFNKVQVLPLGGEKAILACQKILADYSVQHGIAVEGDNIHATLYAMTQEKLKETSFPDNYINLVDETLAGAKFARKSSVTIADFEATIARLLGSEVISVKLGFHF